MNLSEKLELVKLRWGIRNKLRKFNMFEIDQNTSKVKLIIKYENKWHYLYNVVRSFDYNYNKYLVNIKESFNLLKALFNNKNLKKKIN